MFPWPHHRRTLDEEWADLQQAAGINLPCRREHEHTRHCHVYGFHDLRRAFATMNADLPEVVLQHLMQHKSWQTTRGYIDAGRKLRPTLPKLFAPQLPAPEAKEAATDPVKDEKGKGRASGILPYRWPYR
ncbi:MAG TPA: hypothetical protein VKA46_03660 [Gemmataceae bacterium]|nr:hypothetical protein [Gemmataceae bacterium]